MPQLFGMARVGRDVEVRSLNDGSSVANVSLAFNYRHKGEKCVQWVEGVLWNKRADALAQYLLKGTQVSVTIDDIHLETFTKDDETRTKLVGNISQLELGSRPEAAAPPPPPPPKPAPKPATSGFDSMDDEIPF